MRTLESRKQKTQLVTVITICLTALATSACDSTSLSGENNASEQMLEVQNNIDVNQLMRRAAAHDSSHGNLLTDGSFENILKQGWDTCGNSHKVSTSSDATDGKSALKLKKHGCVYQGVDINPGAEIILSCDAKMLSKKNDWTGLGISFYDQYWNHLSDSKAVTVVGNDYQSYEFTEFSPETASYASVWFYTENRALLDNCSLAMDMDEPVSENLLVNADFSDETGGQPTGWYNACGGFSQQFSGNGGSMVLGEGACMHHRPSIDVLQKLQGNYFELSCVYNLTSDGYASMATNLTDSRRLTGNDEVVVLPRNTFPDSPARQFDTITLTGKASDYLTPVDTFIAIGKQDIGMLIVDECSLRVVDDPTMK